MTKNFSKIQSTVAKRRTFAIISHPDAGKTTLTEKLLLFGGAIQLAGAVKARGNWSRSSTPLSGLVTTPYLYTSLGCCIISQL